MAFTDNVILIGALVALALVGNPAGNAAILSYMAATTPDRLQGRANAALMFSAMLLMPFAAVLGGVRPYGVGRADRDARGGRAHRAVRRTPLHEP